MGCSYFIRPKFSQCYSIWSFWTIIFSYLQQTCIPWTELILPDALHAFHLSVAKNLAVSFGMVGKYFILFILHLTILCAIYSVCGVTALTTASSLICFSDARVHWSKSSMLAHMCWAFFFPSDEKMHVMQVPYLFSIMAFLLLMFWCLFHLFCGEKHDCG